MSGYGNYVAVQDDVTGKHFCFAHCTRIFVDVGQRVKEGQAVASVGNTGIGTGEHIHAEIRHALWGNHQANTIDPAPYISSKWSLEGWDGTSGSIFDFLVPNIHIDYSEYFSPSEKLMEMTKSILTILTIGLSRLQEGIPELLFLLIVIDLGWLSCKIATGVMVELQEVVNRFFRYCFYILAFKSWDFFVKEMFIPFFENVGSTYAGRTFEQSDFLKFDKLFTSVTTIIGEHIKPSLDGSISHIVPFIFENVLVITLLVACVALSFWVMVKIMLFYIICIFGILGIPLMFIPNSENHAKNILGSVMVHAIDLILTCFLFGLLLHEVERFQPISAESISGLFLFTGTFLLISYFMGSDLRSASKLFSRILG